MIYKVWMEDSSEDDACDIEATSHEFAAVKFAEAKNPERDYCFVDRDVCVLVREKSSDIVASFLVCGEPTIEFCARLVSEEDLA